MKPWEETWTASEEYDSVHIEDDGDRFDLRKGINNALERCRLAAAAPEMARLLLEHRFAAGGFCDYPCCICCGYEQAGATEKHEDGCQLEALLGRLGMLA
jgi:hypothetical protein